MITNNVNKYKYDNSSVINIYFMITNIFNKLNIIDYKYKNNPISN